MTKLTAQETCSAPVIRLACKTQTFGALLALALLMLSTCAHGQSLPSLLTGDTDTPTEERREDIAAVPDDGVSDQQIETRIRSIFAEFETLEKVGVSVADGVVILEGVVADVSASEKAEDLAQRVSGTVIVVNNLQRQRSVEARLSSASNDLIEKLGEVIAMGPLLLLAAIILGGSLLFARWLGNRDSLFNRLSDNWFIQDLWRQFLKFLVIACGVVFTLNLLDATALLGTVAGALGIAGLAIGFATRDTVENYIASILLSLRQPFGREDLFRINDIEGKVVRLTPRATILMSLEGNHIRIPNAAVFKATMVNFTKNPLRRFDFTVGVDTEIALAGPRALAIATVGSIDGVLESPAPLCLVDALGDSSIILQIQGWIDQRESDYAKTRSEAQRMVKEAFDAAGIVMPEPIYTVNLRQRQAKGGAGVEALAGADQPGPDEVSGNAPQDRTSTVASGTTVGDTRPDEALEEQMRAGETDFRTADLLDDSAPRE